MTDDEIRSHVRELLFSNVSSGYSRLGDIHYHYVKPSPESYPFQFFWDSCFHAIILSALEEHEMAKKDLISLFALQDDDGFVGHMLYWDHMMPGSMMDLLHLQTSLKTKLLYPHMSAIIQPPFAAQAVMAASKNGKDRDFIYKMLPKLKKYHYWLADHRDFEGTGLLSIISPYESGMDFKPTYDPVLGFPEKRADKKLFYKIISVDLRNFMHDYSHKAIYNANYFIVKDAGFNTIYAQALEVMAEMCSINDDPDASLFREQADKVINSIMEIMYDEEDVTFYDVYGRDHRKIKIRTPTIFFPAIIDRIPLDISKGVINAHFFKDNEFATPYPIPSLAVNHPAFNPRGSDYLWRGPTWIFDNWFLHHFLLEKGFEDESSRILESIKALIRKSGFREFYNPFTGEGYGAEDFTWAGLVVDMMNLDLSKKITE